jgi:hypothetical protein
MRGRGWAAKRLGGWAAGVSGKLAPCPLCVSPLQESWCRLFRHTGMDSRGPRIQGGRYPGSGSWASSAHGWIPAVRAGMTKKGGYALTGMPARQLGGRAVGQLTSPRGVPPDARKREAR